jgi:predicted Zn finger-like uncharacterized protein
MKAQCPNCKAVYNIDDSKIPEKGAHVTCKKCQTRFPIKKSASVQTKKDQQVIITCPNCGHVNISSDKCSQCGNQFSNEDFEKLSIQI